MTKLFDVVLFRVTNAKM